MKHTQGEWKHEVQKDGMNIYDVIKHNNQYIATIHVTGSTEEWNANAALIAAAPLLLEALKSCATLIFEVLNITDWTDEEKVKAAIEKATTLTHPSTPAL